MTPLARPAPSARWTALVAWTIWTIVRTGAGFGAAAALADLRTAVAADLPWQPDYAAAIAAARAAHQHMVVLLPAGDAAGCRRLEAALADPLPRGALDDFVWVRLDDAAGHGLPAADGRPTLAFVNPFTHGVLHRAVGVETVERLAREIVHARRAIELPLPPALEPVAARMFSLDAERAESLIAAGDAATLATLLAAAAEDDSRLANYLVARVTLPDGLPPDDVRFLAGSDCLAGDVTAEGAAVPPASRLPDIAGSCAEYPLPESRVVLVPFERTAGAAGDVRITAPGCRLVADTVRFGGRRPDDAVQVRHYELRWLADAEAAPLAGIVLRADGTPAAAAIVRIDDWWDTAAADASATPAVARTGADGRFRFPRVSPGSWLVRAECPGGEIEQLVTIPPPGDAPCTLRLAAVTTVGLRWMLQTREMVQDLAGDGMLAGEAFVSVASSRLSLARGMRIRTADPADLMLAQTPLPADDLPAEVRRGLEPLPEGTPVWYLCDAAYAADFRPLSGMHRETRPFAEIAAVRDSAPLPDEEWAILGPILPGAVAAARGGFFELLRGVPVRAGDVFTLRSAAGNRFAKLEVTDVTIVTPASR